MSEPTKDDPNRIWVLVDGPSDPGPTTVVIYQSEFLVGRTPDNQLVLDVRAISKNHARMEVRPEGLFVRDLGSTNGTFVNGLRADDDVQLREHDVVRFGNVNFRVAIHGSHSRSAIDTSKFDPDWISPLEQELRLERLIYDRALEIHVQPILEVTSHTTIGFEALARPTLEGFPQDAAHLFALAQRAERAGLVSALCRDLAAADEDCRALLAEVAQSCPDQRSFLFSNLHNDELDSDELPSQIEAICRDLEHATLVLEISERSILQAAEAGSLLEPLREAGAWIAFDDFGAGHDRLLQLASHPPEILKFDRLLIQGLHRKNRKIQTLLQGLVDTAKDLGCQVVAEGIETEEQADLCEEIGFDLVQGYYFAMPAPAKQIRCEGFEVLGDRSPAS